MPKVRYKHNKKEMESPSPVREQTMGTAVRSDQTMSLKLV